MGDQAVAVVRVVGDGVLEPVVLSEGAVDLGDGGDLDVRHRRARVQLVFALTAVPARVACRLGEGHKAASHRQVLG
jgi:hypothetical protein